MKDAEDEAFEAIERAQGWRKRQIAEQGEPVIDKSAAIRIATALGWTPPKQEQGEPVACNRGVPPVHPQQKEGETFIVSYEEPQTKQEQSEPVAVWELFADGWDSIADPEWMESLPVGTKLYTTPQQRTWVGLTAEEREKVQAESYGKVPHHVALIAAVEAKLKQKNGYAEENT